MSPSANIETLCLPLFCRGFAYTTLSIVFMASLCEVMDFHHFFQGLSVFNMIHMVIGGCVFIILGFLLFDSPIRRHRSYMLPWRIVGETVRKYYDLTFRS